MDPLDQYIYDLTDDYENDTGLLCSVTNGVKHSVDSYVDAVSFTCKLLMGMEFNLSMKELVMPENFNTLVENVLDHKIKGSKPDEYGNTLLHYACSSSSAIETTALLLKACSPDLEIRNKVGRTPLHLSSLFNNYEATKLLISYGADVDSEDSNGNTPLHYAAVSMSMDSCRVLIDNGADTWAKNLLGATALDCIKDHVVRDAMADYAREHLHELRTHREEKRRRIMRGELNSNSNIEAQQQQQLSQQSQSQGGSTIGTGVNLLSLEEVRTSDMFENYWRLPGSDRSDVAHPEIRNRVTSSAIGTALNSNRNSNSSSSSSSSSSNTSIHAYSSTASASPSSSSSAELCNLITSWIQTVLTQQPNKDIVSQATVDRLHEKLRSWFLHCQTYIDSAGKHFDQFVTKPLDRNPIVAFVGVSILMVVLASYIQ